MKAKRTLTWWEDFWAGQTCPFHREDSEAHYAVYGAELKILFAPYAPRRVLEIGCGNGALFTHLGFERLDGYKGVDISASMLGDFKDRFPGVELVQGSGHDFRDGERYDMVFSNGVVQCFTRDMMDLHARNAATQLAPGGLLVCASVPWRRMRWPFFRGKLGGVKRRRFLPAVRAYLRGLAQDNIGRWFDFAEFHALGRKHGFEPRFFGSLHYMYRFHAVLLKKAP
jgi:SAM-dependent methyltransferase